MLNVKAIAIAMWEAYASLLRAIVDDATEKHSFEPNVPISSLASNTAALPDVLE